jgi:hypothetical protein
MRLLKIGEHPVARAVTRGVPRAPDLNRSVAGDQGLRIPLRGLSCYLQEAVRC